MALTSRYSLLAYLATILFVVPNLCYCFNPKLLNVSRIQTESGWSTARASWYGDPYGAGSSGGACGYENDVSTPPYSSLITAAASSLFNSGAGCGLCYQVKCTTHRACSGNPVTVVVTDECPGCDPQSIQFDLSGTSFGTMSNSGEAGQLRSVGIQDIKYKRVACNFHGVSVAFRVDAGSNQNYFAVLILFENGYGLSKVELKQAGYGGAWRPMQRSWGSVWRLNVGSGLQPPFSMRLTSGGGSGKTIVATDVIPADYDTGKTYRSTVNF
ncbi:expansin-B15-like [Primulina eburnea]|uniref:expansin-B15-like n=1 Tax=Primulina eburnea TaxID=1245227 RepID=UPI003C6BE4D2